jgi:hypothetical protein
MKKPHPSKFRAFVRPIEIRTSNFKNYFESKLEMIFYCLQMPPFPHDGTTSSHTSLMLAIFTIRVGDKLLLFVPLPRGMVNLPPGPTPCEISSQDIPSSISSFEPPWMDTMLWIPRSWFQDSRHRDYEEWVQFDVRGMGSASEFLSRFETSGL